MNQQKLAGVAALFETAAFLIGFWVYFAVLGPAQYGSAEVEPGRHVAFLVDHQILLTAWNLVIYVAFGLALVVLSLGLQARLREGAPALANTAAAFGLIWAGLVIASGMVANVGLGVIAELYATDPAQAATVWLTYKFVVAGLGGGNEIVGGLWVLLTSLAALRFNGLPRPLNLLGLVIGAAGLLTTLPPLSGLGEIFGLGLIVWFGWLGVVLLRGGRGLKASGAVVSAAA